MAGKITALDLIKANQTQKLMDAGSAVVNRNNETYQRVEEARKSGTLYEKMAETPATALDMQKKKEDRAEGLFRTEAERRAKDARKALQEYKLTDEYKDNQKKIQQDQYVKGILFGVKPEYEADDKEKQLQKDLDYWDGQVQQERDAKTTQRDMAAMESWSDEDKAALEQYISDRETAFVQSFSPFATGLPADYESNPLIAKYGRARLDQIASSYQRMKNQQEYEAAQQTGREYADKGAIAAIGANAASIGANLADTLLNPLERIAQGAVGRDDRYSTLDPYAGGQAAAYASGVRDETAKNIAGSEEGVQVIDGITGREALALGYQGGMSAADSVARGLIGGTPVVGAGLAALGSFNQTLRQASEQGASPEQAVKLATVNSAIEMATEKLPLDELFKVAKGGAKPAAKVIGNILRQAGIEILEEEASLIGTTLAEAAILQEKSSYNQQVMEAMANGATQEQARARANRALLAEAIHTAIVSGISGAASGAGAEYAAARYVGTPETEVQTEAQEQMPDQMQQGTQEAQSQPEQDNWMAKTFREAMGETQKAAVESETNAVSNPVESYPPEKQNMIRSFIQSVDQNIKGFVQRVKGGDTTFERRKITDVSDRAAKDIGSILGVDASGYTHNINTNGIKHILKRHGENGKHDQSMSLDDDIARVGWVLDNYDSVDLLKKDGKQVFSTEFLDRDGNPAPQIVFVKKIDGSYYVAETVFDNKFKKLWVQSVRLQKNNGDVTQTPAEGQLTNHETNARSDFASPSPVNTIAENGTQVNGNLGSTQQADTSGEYTEDGQVKGTGAAERGFTPKQRLINEYGSIPEGENPVRPDQLPTSTDGTDRVSRTARTAMEARVTPDEFVPLIEREAVNGGFSFIPIRNDDTVQAATEAISREGWQTSRANWTANVRAGVTSPEITATGALLYNHAVNAGDTRDAMEILMDYQMAVRNSARSLQAARILKTLTPSDRLWMIRRSVDAMVQDMHLQNPVTINETLAQNYQNAGTQEEADEILDQIAEDVARQIPATRMEAFTALRYLNMLGNFRTQVRNIAGNAGSKVVYGIKDKIGAGIETIASALTDGRVERTKSLVTDRRTQQAAAADYDLVRDWLLGGGRYNDRQTESEDFARRVQDRRRMLPPGLEQYRRATNWAINAGDELFARSAYSRALAGYLNARGIRTDNFDTVDANLMDRAREYAVRQAQEQTFRDNNQISDFVSGMLRGRNTPAWARVIGEGIMPFRKTPANVLVRAEEFSPLGLINSAVNTVRAAQGNITGAELIDSWAKSLTGSALTVLGMALFDFGVLSGGPDEDEEKAAFDRMNGLQDYALTFTVDGETYSYTVDWATPAAMPLFLGAQLQRLFSQEEDLKWSDYDKVITAIGDPLIQMSMLQGVNDTLENIRYAENNMGQFLINAAVSYLTQGLTNTLLGQIEKSTEDTRQTTYIDKDSEMPQWMQKQLGKASQKMPGWDFQQTDYINARGATEQQRTDALGWLYNLTSPGYVKKADVDDIAQELYRLNDAGVEGNVFPESPATTFSWTDKTGTVHKDYNLTAQQAETLKRQTGQISMRIAEDIIHSKDYAALTDAQKAEAIRTAYSYARKTGEIAAIGEEHTGYSDAWMMEMETGKEAEYIIRKAVRDNLNGAMESFSTARKKKYDTTTAENEMQWAYDAFKAMSEGARSEIRESADSSAANYIEARDAGVSHDKYLDVSKLLAGIVPEKGKKEASDIQKSEAIMKTSGLTAKQKELLVKQQVSDAQDKNIDELKALGYAADKYVKLYRDYLDYTKGNGKKKRTIEKWMQDYNITYSAAEKLYEVFP